MTAALLLSLLLPAAVAGEPYALRVQLAFADDPIFTRFYMESTARGVRDQLAGYFGPLAKVDVEQGAQLVWGENLLSDRAEAAKGGAPGNSAGKESSSSPVGPLDKLALQPADFARFGVVDKRFLFEIRFHNGLYQLVWRQVDGAVQYVGPLRSQATPDRHWLVKAICLTVRDDFAPTAVVEPQADGREVRLTFRGANAAGRLNPWLKPGSVLQPLWVVRQKDGGTSREPIPNTLLLLDNKDATRATTVSARAYPWQRTARIIGFEAIWLPACAGRIRLKLVDATDGSPVLDAAVSASGQSFAATGDRDRLPDPDRDGIVTSPQAFDRVAYLTIKAGATYQVPLPITDAWCDLTLKVQRDPRLREKNDWLRRLRYVAQDVQVLTSVLDAQVRQVNALNSEKRYEEALRQTKTTGETVRPLLTEARQGAGELRREAKAIDLENSAMLGWVDQQLGEVGTRAAALDTLAGDLSKTIDDINSQNLAKVSVAQAGQCEAACDFDQALALFEQALRQWPDQPDTKRHYEQLKESWRVKDDEHAAARQFVRDRWTKADIKELGALLPEMKRHFAVFKRHDDKLATRLFLKCNGEHLRNLGDLVQMLSARGESKEECDTYAKLTDDVAKFHVEVGDFLQGSPKATPPELPGG